MLALAQAGVMCVVDDALEVEEKEDSYRGRHGLRCCSLP